MLTKFTLSVYDESFIIVECFLLIVASTLCDIYTYGYVHLGERSMNSKESGASRETGLENIDMLLV